MCDRLGDEAADLRAMRCRGEKNMPTEEQRYESLDECLKRVEAERDTLAARVEELEDAVEYGKLVNEKLSDYYVAASGKGDCIFGFPCPRDDQEERIGCATCAAIAAQVEVDAALEQAEACPPDGVAYNPQVAPIAEVEALKAERDKLAARVKGLEGRQLPGDGTMDCKVCRHYNGAPCGYEGRYPKWEVRCDIYREEQPDWKAERDTLAAELNAANLQLDISRKQADEFKRASDENAARVNELEEERWKLWGKVDYLICRVLEEGGFMDSPPLVDGTDTRSHDAIRASEGFRRMAKELMLFRREIQSAALGIPRRQEVLE